MTQVCQKQTSWMVLRQPLFAVGVQKTVLLQQLLCNLQNLVVEGKPGIRTDHTQDLWVPQAAACATQCCCWPRRQKAPASVSGPVADSASIWHIRTQNACLPAKAMQPRTIACCQCEGVLLNMHRHMSCKSQNSQHGLDHNSNRAEKQPALHLWSHVLLWLDIVWPQWEAEAS